MNNLSHTLATLQQLLEELHAVLAQEQERLQQPQVDPVSLQRLSDNKSRLLSALNFYDAQRRSQEKALQIAAPYASQRELQPRWEAIVATVRLTKAMNLAIYPLIELQMKKAAALNKLVSKAGSGAALYRADGSQQNSLKGQAYDINI